MAGTIRRSLRLYSPLKVEEEEAKFTENKQGIVSILGSSCEQTKATSLRRTLSADMSSRKWLTQHAFSFSFSPMKKIASSEELAIPVADSSSSSEGEEEEYEGRIWSSIQSGNKEEVEKAGQLDIWSSILYQKPNDDDSSKLPPPYVHPLVKRSTSSLSEKSLQICTESLGSETGSDGFSSYAPPSETGDVEDDKEAPPKPQLQQREKAKEWLSIDREELLLQVVKMQPKSFPPPLPSLACGDGPSLRVQPHRENGRLVLEAVSVPSQNWLRAQRQDGRLLLTFVAGEDEEEEEEEEEAEELVEKLEKDDNGGKEDGLMVAEQTEKLSCGVISVHRSALMMKKLMGLENRNPSWTKKFNKAVNLVEMEEEEEGPAPLAQSILGRPPRVGRLIPSSPPSTAEGAACFNAYEYFWRTKPSGAVASLMNPMMSRQSQTLKNHKALEEREMVVLRGNKAEYLVPLLRGCKEHMRSLLIWDHNCIASS